MKQTIILLISIFGLNACVVQNNIESVEYVEKTIDVVANGDESPEKTKMLFVCYNRYFNQDRYSAEFITKNKLNSIDYKKNMAIQVFLGETSHKVNNLSNE